MSIPDCEKDRCANTQIHKYNDKDRCAIIDGSMRCRCHMAIPLLGRGGDASHPKNTYVQIHKYTHVLYTGVLKVQMRMVGAGR